MAKKFIGYVPEEKTWVDSTTGEPRSINRVRVNIVSESVPGVVGMDVEYYMVKKEDLESVLHVKSYDELKGNLGKRCLVELRIDVRSQKPLLSQIEFV